MPVEITAEQLVQKVREQAQAHPDKVYRKDPEVNSGSACVYAHSKEPGCIIGWALHDLGWSLDDLRTLDDFDDAGIVDLVDDGNIPGVTLDQAGVDWLSRVQSLQDSGERWGEAVAQAGQSA